MAEPSPPSNPSPFSSQFHRVCPRRAVSDSPSGVRSPAFRRWSGGRFRRLSLSPARPFSGWLRRLKPGLRTQKRSIGGKSFCSTPPVEPRHLHRNLELGLWPFEFLLSFENKVPGHWLVPLGLKLAVEAAGIERTDLNRERLIRLAENQRSEPMGSLHLIFTRLPMRIAAASGHCARRRVVYPEKPRKKRAFPDRHETSVRESARRC